MIFDATASRNASASIRDDDDEVGDLFNAGATDRRARFAVFLSSPAPASSDRVSNGLLPSSIALSGTLSKDDVFSDGVGVVGLDRYDDQHASVRCE